MNRDVEQMLHDLGSSPVPPPSQAFADNLESDLRVLVANSSVAAARGRFGRWPATVAALGFTAAVIVFALVTLTSGPTEIYIGPVSNAEVILPTGERFEASPGVALPPGAVVLTGDEGSVTIGDNVYGPNSNVVVAGDGDEVEQVDDEEIAILIEELSEPSVPSPTVAVSRSGDVAAPQPSAPDDEVVTTETSAVTTSAPSTEPATVTTPSEPPGTTTSDPLDVTPTSTTAAPETTEPPQITDVTEPRVTSTVEPTVTTHPPDTGTDTTIPVTTVPDVSSTTTTTEPDPDDSTTTTTTTEPDPDDGSTTTTDPDSSTTTEPDDSTTTTSTSTTTTEVKVDPASDDKEVDPIDPTLIPRIIAERDPVTGRIIGEILENSRIIIKMLPAEPDQS